MCTWQNLWEKFLFTRSTTWIDHLVEISKLLIRLILKCLYSAISSKKWGFERHKLIDRSSLAFINTHNGEILQIKTLPLYAISIKKVTKNSIFRSKEKNYLQIFVRSTRKNLSKYQEWAIQKWTFFERTQPSFF